MLANSLLSPMSDVPPNLRCWEWLEPELWLSRFAKRFREKQPQVDESIALDTAKLLRPMLRLETPENAVTIFLDVMHQRHLRIGAEVTEALQRIQRESSQRRDAE